MLFNSSNNSNCDVLLEKYNGEENNFRRNPFKEVTTKEKISPVNYKKMLFVLKKANLSYYESDKGVRIFFFK